jgi:hypothetical protein
MEIYPMSLASSLLYPTTFLHNQYVALLELERGAAIGEALPEAPAMYQAGEKPAETPPQTPSQSLQLAVRVTSLAHAAIQFVVAALETLPLLVATTVTILSNCSHERLNRVHQAAVCALRAAWSPVRTSIETLIYPDTLSSRYSPVSSQKVLLARLLANSLPSLSKIAGQLTPEGRTALEQGIADLFPAPEGEPDAVALDPLQRAETEESAIGWRGELDALMQLALTNDPAARCSDFDFSPDFVRTLIETVRRSLNRKD